MRLELGQEYEGVALGGPLNGDWICNDQDRVKVLDPPNLPLLFDRMPIPRPAPRRDIAVYQFEEIHSGVGRWVFKGYV